MEGVIFKEKWENLDGGGGEGRGVSQDQLFRMNAVDVNAIFKKTNPPKFVILSGILIVIQFGRSQRIISCSVEIITIAQANVRLNSWLNN